MFANLVAKVTNFVRNTVRAVGAAIRRAPVLATTAAIVAFLFLV
jgi:hypothetical protein